MRKQRLPIQGQPEVLADGLQNATIVNDLRVGERTSVPQPARVGVPHGVRAAIVRCRNLRLEWEGGHPAIYFCGTGNYEADASSVTDGDGSHHYPNEVFVSSSGRLPERSGFYDARMRVSINGAVHVHIERMVPAADPV